MKKYLESTDIIDFTHPKVAQKARELEQGCSSDTQIVKRCFEFVRDEIRHTGDAGEGSTTLHASEVLEQGQGWCYAKVIFWQHYYAPTVSQRHCVING